jgi:hypothetical protein
MNFIFRDQSKNWISFNSNLQNKSIKYILKGQCHKKVFEMSPWSSSLDLDKWAHTLFPFNNRCLHRVFIDVKTESSYPADFATTWYIIHWWVLALHAMAGSTFGISRPSQCNMPIDLKPGHSKISQNLPAVAYWANPLGKAHCDSRDMPLYKWPQSAN